MTLSLLKYLKESKFGHEGTKELDPYLVKRMYAFVLGKQNPHHTFSMGPNAKKELLHWVEEFLKAYEEQGAHSSGHKRFWNRPDASIPDLDKEDIPDLGTSYPTINIARLLGWYFIEDASGSGTYADSKVTFQVIETWITNMLQHVMHDKKLHSVYKLRSLNTEPFVTSYA